jgi:NADPH-dependent FMN reductase
MRATLPRFNPDDDREGEPVHAAIAELREHIAAADALVLCAPEYAGALPGALKNLLEWTVGDAGTYRPSWCPSSSELVLSRWGLEPVVVETSFRRDRKVGLAARRSRSRRRERPGRLRLDQLQA